MQARHKLKQIAIFQAQINYLKKDTIADRKEPLGTTPYDRSCWRKGY